MIGPALLVTLNFAVRTVCANDPDQQHDTRRCMPWIATDPVVRRSRKCHANNDAGGLDWSES
jgi:hypothetical protein